MSNQSMFVKVTIWFMVFLMSVGFAALIITPFMGTSLFGGDGRSATEKLLNEAREDVRALGCTKTPVPEKNLDECRKAFIRLGSAYQTLAYPSDPNATEYPRDYQRNIDRSGDAYRAAHELDTKNTEAAKRYGAYLRDAGKFDQAIVIWSALAKAHPKEEDYLLQIGVAQQQSGRLDEAIETYQRFVKNFPESGQVNAIKDEIKNIREQQKEQADGGGNAPITVG